MNARPGPKRQAWGQQIQDNGRMAAGPLVNTFAEGAVEA